MIIDFHTHTFPDEIAEHALDSLKSKSHTVPFSDGTTDGLVARDREAGIDLAIVLPVATNPGQVRSVNDRAAETNRKYGTVDVAACGASCDADGGAGSSREAVAADAISASAERCVDGTIHLDGGSDIADAATESKLISFAAIHPAMDDACGELRRVKSLGFRGIKIHPAYQGMDIDAAPYISILETAADLGLIVVTHSGWDIGLPGAEQCLPDKIRRAVKAADPEGKTLKFVAAHMGGWRIWEEVPKQLADTGVYIDTSFSTDRWTVHTLRHTPRNPERNNGDY